MFADCGLRPVGERSPATFWLWPENVEPWNLFIQLDALWREGASGHPALDLPGVDIHLRYHVPRSQRRERMRQIQLMERAARRAWTEGE